MKNVGEPCAGEPHARFDGRELETEHADHGHRGGTTVRETGGTQAPGPTSQQLPPRQLPTQPTSRAVTRAQARDKVARNVVLLCETPTGQIGRPSKALTLQQAHALVEHARGSTMGAYVLVSLLTGARTEELRALTWSHVDLTGSPHTDPPIPAHIRVWRSVRAGGDTKTRASRRTLARCPNAA